MKTVYKTRATSFGGRDGHVVLDDGSLALDLLSFNNEHGKKGANPEQLFAMGYAACFDNALIHTIRQQKLEGVSMKISGTLTEDLGCQ